jgi:hypothetical protein
MRITSAGDVGIGTSSPALKLHISSATTDDGIRIQNTSAANSTAKTTRIAFYGTDTGSSTKEAADIYTIPENANYISTALTFHTRRDDVVAEKVRIDSSGNLLVGTTTATQKLTVSGSIGATGAFIPYNGATIVGYIGNGASLTSATDMGLRCDTGNIVFGFSGTERVRISASGGLSVGTNTDAGVNNLIVNGTGRFGTTVGVGAATPSSSGAGITFPATDSASSNANTLDDYEEGIWTPSYTLGGGSVSGVTSSGSYVKIGKQVTLNFQLTFTTVTSATLVAITGFPFPVSNTSERSTGASRENSNTGSMWQLTAVAGGTSGAFYKYDNTSLIASGYTFFGSITYFV